MAEKFSPVWSLSTNEAQAWNPLEAGWGSQGAEAEQGEGSLWISYGSSPPVGRLAASRKADSG